MASNQALCTWWTDAKLLQSRRMHPNHNIPLHIESKENCIAKRVILWTPSRILSRPISTTSILSFRRPNWQVLSLRWRLITLKSSILTTCPLSWQSNKISTSYWYLPTMYRVSRQIHTMLMIRRYWDAIQVLIKRSWWRWKAILPFWPLEMCIAEIRWMLPISQFSIKWKVWEYSPSTHK